MSRKSQNQKKSSSLLSRLAMLFRTSQNELLSNLLLPQTANQSPTCMGIPI